MHSEDRRPTVLHWNWEDCQIRRPFVLVSRSWLDDWGGSPEYEAMDGCIC